MPVNVAKNVVQECRTRMSYKDELLIGRNLNNLGLRV